MKKTIKITSPGKRKGQVIVLDDLNTFHFPNSHTVHEQTFFMFEGLNRNVRIFEKLDGTIAEVCFRLPDTMRGGINLKAEYIN